MIRAACGAVACLALAGCAAPVGDFGRREGGIYADTMTEVSGPFAHAYGVDRRAVFEYTDEEREMRLVGWDLVRPPDRDVPGNALSEFRWWRTLPDSYYGDYPQAYWRALILLPVSSHETRYRRIILQARADSQRMPLFRDVASRVGLADGARRSAADALAANAAMRQEAERRIAENRAVVETVCRAMAIRISAYRYALGRLMVETPATLSVETEAAINGLDWEVNACLMSLRVGVGGGGPTVITPHRRRFVPGGGGVVRARG